MSSWRSGTIKQYKSYLEQWEQFCIVNNVSVFEPGIGKVIEFLTELFHTGLGYSAINTARSALSSVILLPGGRPVGEHPPYLSFSKGSVRVKTSFTQIYRDLGCWNSVKVPENIIPSTGYYAKAAYSENDNITLLIYWTEKSYNTQI